MKDLITYFCFFISNMYPSGKGKGVSWFTIIAVSNIFLVEY